MPIRTLAMLGVLFCAGCATTNTSTLASRFVRQGTPAVDLGGPRPAFKSKSMAVPPPMVDATLTTGVSRTASAASLESFDPELRRALAAVSFAPTASHHIDVARAYRRQGIFDQAYDYLTRSLAVNGPEPTVYDERARLWRDWGHPGLGLTDAHQAVYLAPQSAPFRNTLGTLLYVLGHPRDAEEQFQRALTLVPDAWYALANLCYVNMAQGRTREAITLCHRAGVARNKQKQPQARPDSRQ